MWDTRDLIKRRPKVLDTFLKNNRKFSLLSIIFNTDEQHSADFLYSDHSQQYIYCLFNGMRE